MNTKEMILLFSMNQSDSVKKMILESMDREELYVFENRIHKKLIEMNHYEIISMINTYKYGKTRTLSKTRKNNILSLISRFFDWYNENIGFVKNPCESIGMEEEKHKLNKNTIDDYLDINEFRYLISRIHDDFEYKNEYFETILLLFFEGFDSSKEIVLLKKEMINFENKTITFENKVLNISDRLLYLLKKMDSLEELESRNRVYKMARWKEYYFRYPVRSVHSDVDNFDKEILMERLSWQVKKIRDFYMDYRINGYNIYILGLYNFIVNKLGYDETKKLLTQRYQQENERFKNIISLYGVNNKAIYNIKNKLVPFLEMEQEVNPAR